MFAVSVVVWACGKYDVLDAKLFAVVAVRFSSSQQADVCSLPGPATWLTQKWPTWFTGTQPEGPMYSFQLVASVFK